MAAQAGISLAWGSGEAVMGLVGPAFVAQDIGARVSAGGGGCCGSCGGERKCAGLYGATQESGSLDDDDAIQDWADLGIALPDAQGGGYTEIAMALALALAAFNSVVKSNPLQRLLRHKNCDLAPALIMASAVG